MFTLRVMVTHTLSYFLLGLIMSNLFDYTEIFQREIIRDFMLPINDRTVIGPLLQPIRGLIFALGLWPLREILLEKKRGWLVLWGLLVTIGILSTPSAAPSSVEGLLYSKLPVWYHLMGLPEILLQTLLFSVWLLRWERRASAPQGGEPKKNPLLTEILKAVVTACLAYIGYAVGGLILAAIANAKAKAEGSAAIDIGAMGADFKTQFMFVVAFILNAAVLFTIARTRRPKRPWIIFCLFWFIDSAVPWLYQMIVFGSSSIPMTILLGFFPALIIGLSMGISTKKGRP